jgi:hypothetical protein
MQIEISDPALVDSLRAYLQRQGCPSEAQSADVVEVRVLWSPDAPLSDAQARTKVFGHLREWCAANPGVKTNLLA